MDLTFHMNIEEGDLQVRFREILAPKPCEIERRNLPCDLVKRQRRRFRDGKRKLLHRLAIQRARKLPAKRCAKRHAATVAADPRPAIGAELMDARETIPRHADI